MTIENIQQANRTVREHRAATGENGTICRVCNVDFPCPERKEATDYRAEFIAAMDSGSGHGHGNVTDVHTF